MESVPINFQVAEFTTSAPSLKQCPEDSGCEVAFAGRSNAGKSSAINTLTHVKDAYETLEASLTDTVGNYEIPSVVESPILDVFPYYDGQEETPAEKPEELEHSEA